jgi:hypothetical protein
VFHERKKFVEILAPLEDGVEAGIADVLRELNIPTTAITWTHDQIDRQALFAGVTSTRENVAATDADLVTRYLRETSLEARHEIIDAYASQFSARHSQLLYERLIRLMKRHRSLSDVRHFEQIIAEDSLGAFSYWVDQMTIEYERELRRYDRLSRGLGWVVIAFGSAASVSALASFSSVVLPLVGAATLLAAAQVALQPEKRSRRTQEFVDRFIQLRYELDSLSTVRDITPLNALQWQRLEKAITLVEE